MASGGQAQRGADEAGQSLSDHVISEVRQRIIDQSLSTDRSFTEGEIAAMLQVSKSPVREALSLLRRQGWIAVHPRSGYRVHPLTLHDAQSLMTIRVALEPEAAAAAARRSARYPDQVQALRAFAGHRPGHGTDAAHRIEHYRFHKRICVLSANAELERVLSEVLLKLQRYDWLTSESGEPNEPSMDHKTLASAIADHDPDQARRAATDHVIAARDTLLDSLMASEPLLVARLHADSSTAGRRQNKPHTELVS